MALTDLEEHQTSGSPIQRTDLAICGAFFAVSLLAGWLLSLVYPYGFTNFETYSFEEIARGFRLWAPNSTDWFRTIPYGALLAWSRGFANPSMVSYWVCTVLFSASIPLTYVLAKLLFQCRSRAVLAALAALLIEII